MSDATTIVTIDGPAGAGKSTLARAVAKELGFEFLDTGAIYRAATLACLNAGIDLASESRDIDAVKETVDAADVTLSYDDEGALKVNLDNNDVTTAIRTKNVTDHIRYVADLAPVREGITALTRRIAEGDKYVSEGRDQGTVVFPNAMLKIYLWATPAERARRRAQDLETLGESVESLEELERDIRRRDMLDMSREIGGLKKAADAVELDTTQMSVVEATRKIAELARELM